MGTRGRKRKICYEAIIAFAILNPTMFQGEIAREFQTTQSRVSHILCRGGIKSLHRGRPLKKKRGQTDEQHKWEALHANQLDSIDGGQLLVARAHDTSVCHPTQLGSHRQFPSVPKDELPAEFFEAIKPKAAVKPKKNKQ